MEILNLKVSYLINVLFYIPYLVFIFISFSFYIILLILAFYSRFHYLYFCPFLLAELLKKKYYTVKYQPIKFILIYESFTYCIYCKMNVKLLLKSHISISRKVTYLERLYKISLSFPGLWWPSGLKFESYIIYKINVKIAITVIFLNSLSFNIPLSIG